MTSRLRLGLSLLLLALTSSTLAGCGAWFRQPANVEATREEVSALRRDQTELLALVRELKARLERQSESMSALRADSNLQLRQLEERLDMLMAQLEEQGMRFERMQRDGGSSSAPFLPDTSGTSASGGVSRSSAAGLFEAAQRDFNRGNYQLAIAGFDDFLELAPSAEQADNAQYWKGECYYSLGDMDRAIQEFLKVRDIYPEGDAVASATLKIGYAFLRKGDSATAGRYFETVVREFPGTDEATLAGDKLEEIR